jgi:hypothetical protein
MLLFEFILLMRQVSIYFDEFYRKIILKLSRPADRLKAGYGRDPCNRYISPHLE